MKKSYVFYAVSLFLISGHCQCSDGPAGLEALKAKIKSGNPTERRQGISEAVSSRTEEAYGLIGEAMSDGNTQVRIAAIEAAGTLKIAALLPSLTAMLSDPKQQIRQSAVLTLGTIGEQSSGSALLKALDDQDAGVRDSVIRVLGKMRIAGARDRLVGLIHDRNEIIAKDALWALGEIGDPSVRKEIYSLLDSSSTHPSAVIQQEAAHVLSLFGMSDSETYLLSLFESKDQSVKLNAALGLAALNSVVPQKYAIELLKSPESRMRFEAVEILGRIGNYKCREALKKVSEVDPDPEVRNLSADYLKKPYEPGK